VIDFRGRHSEVFAACLPLLRVLYTVLLCGWVCRLLCVLSAKLVVFHSPRVGQTCGCAVPRGHSLFHASTPRCPSAAHRADCAMGVNASTPGVAPPAAVASYRGMLPPPGSSGTRPAFPGPYASGPYAGGGAGGVPLTPEALHAAFMAGVPPHMLLHGGGFFAPGGGMPAPPQPRVEQATMIKNDVNLRKGTMRWLRRAGPAASAGDELFLDFRFDANEPCAVTVYYLVTSNESVHPSVSLVSRLERYRFSHSGRRVLFPRGLNQHFCQARYGADGGGDASECLHLSQCSAAELTTSPTGPDGEGATVVAERAG